MNSKTAWPRAARWIAVMALCCCHVASAQTASMDSRRELRLLTLEGLKHNPRVTAAREAMRNAMAAYEGRSGFYDTRLVANLGYRNAFAAVPGDTRAPGIQDDALSASAGIDKAVNPGAYLTLGAAERYLSSPGDPYDSLYQTVLGARLTVPLARDRQFAVWATGTEAIRCLVAAASNDLVAAMQSVEHDVELAYLSALHAMADEALARQASQRVTKLLAEAEERVRLKVIPEYQLYAARLEVSLSLEDIRIAEQTTIAERIRLTQLLGQTDPVRLEADSDRLLDLAAASGNTVETTDLDACRRRGVYLAAGHRVQAAERELQQARERCKPDIALYAAATWRVEDPDSVVGSEALLADDVVGAEVAVVWRHAIGFRAEKAEMRAREALLRAAEEDLRRVRLQIAAELATARSALSATTDRLGLAQKAVHAAGQTLAAEEERFGLGEGRSRNVLDAQKDLTAAARRRYSAAAGLLRAHADFRYAAGVDIREDK